MLHLGHRDCLQNLGLGVFHLSDYFAQDQQNEEEDEERCRNEQKAQAWIVCSLIDYDTRNFSDLLYTTADTAVRCWCDYRPWCYRWFWRNYRAQRLRCSEIRPQRFGRRGVDNRIGKRDAGRS